MGPMLFLLYINDLASASVKLKNIMFADDTNLFLTGSSIRDVEDQLNLELLSVNIWFKANLLSLNVKKTSYIIFGHRKNLMPTSALTMCHWKCRLTRNFLG